METAPVLSDDVSTVYRPINSQWGNSVKRITNPLHFAHQFCTIFRFSKERVAARHKCAFLPFSVGPRNCLGMRFSILESKMAVIRLLSDFRLVACDRTPAPPIPCKTSFIYAPEDGVWVKLEKRDKVHEAES